MVRQITEEQASKMFSVPVNGLYFLFETEQEQETVANWLGTKLKSSTNNTVANIFAEALLKYIQYEGKESPEDTINNLQEELQESYQMINRLEEDNKQLTFKLEQTKEIINVYKDSNIKGDSEIIKDLLATIKDLTAQVLESKHQYEQAISNLADKAISEVSSAAKSLQEIQSRSNYVIQQPVQQMQQPLTTQVMQPQIQQAVTEELSTTLTAHVKQETLTGSEVKQVVKKQEEDIPSLSSMQSLPKVGITKPKVEPILKVDKTKMVNTQQSSEEPSLEEIIARNKKMSGG